jgi:hypothetical protein
MGSGVNFKYMLAGYNFDSNIIGLARFYYQNLRTNGGDYRMYYGNAYPDMRFIDNEPHRSEANGVYFDGNDYMY